MHVNRIICATSLWTEISDGYRTKTQSATNSPQCSETDILLPQLGSSFSSREVAEFALGAAAMRGVGHHSSGTAIPLPAQVLLTVVSQQHIARRRSATQGSALASLKQVLQRGLSCLVLPGVPPARRTQRCLT